MLPKSLANVISPGVESIQLNIWWLFQESVECWVREFPLCVGPSSQMDRWDKAEQGCLQERALPQPYVVKHGLFFPSFFLLKACILELRPPAPSRSVAL